MELEHLTEKERAVILDQINQLIDIEISLAKDRLQQGASRYTLEDFFHETMIITIGDGLFLQEINLSPAVFTDELQNKVIELGRSMYSEELSKMFPDFK